MQTPDEMIEAIQAFKRDGKIGLDSFGGGFTHNPTWSFDQFEYYPCKKEELKIPALGSHWRSVANPDWEQIINNREANLKKVYMNNKWISLAIFLEEWEPII